MKLKGGILYYALFLMLISVVVITMIMMRHSLYQQSFINRCKSDELELNIKSALLIYKQNPQIFNNEDSILLDLFKDSLSLVQLSRERWGIFDIVSASTGWKHLSLTRTGFYGEVIDDKDPALYVPDHGIDVSLSGNSFISGTTYMPDGIFRTASIEGQPFIYHATSDGTVLPSGSELPCLDPVLDSTITNLFREIFPEVCISDINRKTDWLFENSFNNQVITYYENRDALLSGLSFKGKIIICAPGTIVVDRTTTLGDVLLIARKIIVDEGFEGSFQAFAIDSIGIGNNVRLSYPSVLCIISDDKIDGASSSPAITLGSNTSVAGCVIVKSLSGKGSLVIPETSLLTGQAYCNGNVELGGDIHGSLFCDGFSFISDRSTYINHLLNSDINIDMLPEGFAGYHVGDSASVKSLIRWLD